jgi:osmotically inducible protein OsmC
MNEQPRVIFIASRSAEVEWTGSLQTGSGVVSVPSAVLVGAGVTYPSRVGEPEGHTSPEELVAAAHAGCYAMSLAAVLGKRSVAYQGLSVNATLTLSRVDGQLTFTRAELNVVVRGEDVDEEAMKAAVEEADGRCPVSNALRATMPVTVATVAAAT